MCANSKARVILVALFSLSSIPLFPKAMAGNASIIESSNKAVISSAAQSEDFITGGLGDLIVTDGFYSMAAFPKPRHPLFSFNEIDLQLGYMLPIIGRSFYRGNFEGLANLFFWESLREHSGILGGGALGIHYNFVQPGWRFVPYVGASLGVGRDNLYVQHSQQIFGGPFEFVLQAKAGARYFSQAHIDFMLGYLEFERLRDAAILDNFFLSQQERD